MRPYEDANYNGTFTYCGKTRYCKTHNPYDVDIAGIGVSPDSDLDTFHKSLMIKGPHFLHRHRRLYPFDHCARIPLRVAPGNLYQPRRRCSYINHNHFRGLLL